MKTELKAKFIQHLLGKKKDNEGFTLIELLVVIIIIGILSAIALPSFLSQANKGKQAESKQYTGSMNRAQQAYYLENAAFADSITKMGIGIKDSTENYSYGIALTNTNSQANNFGLSKKPALKSYAGTTYLQTIADASGASTLAILCESTASGVIATNPGDGGLGSCPSNFTVLSSK